MQSKLRCTASFSDQSPHGFHLVGGFHPLSPRLGRFARSGQPGKEEIRDFDRHRSPSDFTTPFCALLVSIHVRMRTCTSFGARGAASLIDRLLAREASNVRVDHRAAARL